MSVLDCATLFPLKLPAIDDQDITSSQFDPTVHKSFYIC